MEVKEVILPIGGMTCAACAKRVEKAIAALEGVEKTFVNIATEKAAVTYDSQKLRLSDIRIAVEKAGYSRRSLTKTIYSVPFRAKKLGSLRTKENCGRLSRI